MERNLEYDQSRESDRRSRDLKSYENSLNCNEILKELTKIHFAWLKVGLCKNFVDLLSKFQE